MLSSTLYVAMEVGIQPWYIARYVPDYDRTYQPLQHSHTQPSQLTTGRYAYIIHHMALLSSTPYHPDPYLFVIRTKLE